MGILERSPNDLQNLRLFPDMRGSPSLLRSVLLTGIMYMIYSGDFRNNQGFTLVSAIREPSSSMRLSNLMFLASGTINPVIFSILVAS